MEAQQMSVNLDLITVSSTNNIFRAKKDFSPAALKELASSIAQDDVIQPILITPDAQRPGHYKLIAGERRYHASKLAGKTQIPANIKQAVTDEKAFELQMIENLQREKVHPFNEARGYKILMDNNTEMTTAELAKRVGRSETYIIQRLKLNDLVPEGRKDFLANHMLLGHALLLARLTPQNQREAIQEAKNYNDGYGTVKELENYINRSITNLLSSAPFDKEDTTLFPKAGACTMCPKRSGASPLLFSDIKEADRCMDRMCFIKKSNTHVIQRTREIIESEPEIVLLQNYADTLPEVQELLNQHNVKPLKEYTDFNTHDRQGKKVKGFWISGSEQGKQQTIHIRKASKHETVNSDQQNLKTLISKIQERTKRGKELDAEKVHVKIIEALKTHPTQKPSCKMKIMLQEEALLWYILIDKAGYHGKAEINKILGLNKSNQEKTFKILSSLKPEQKAIILRKVMLDQYAGIYPSSDYGLIVRKIAEAYSDIDIKGFEAEQQLIRTKRESRAQEKIQALKKEFKTTIKKK
ncbi:MAG: ParB/RepB/Spo0J family partition protein [Cyclobacteriaceae bacterium]